MRIRQFWVKHNNAIVLSSWNKHQHSQRLVIYILDCHCCEAMWKPLTANKPHWKAFAGRLGYASSRYRTCRCGMTLRYSPKTPEWVLIIDLYRSKIGDLLAISWQIYPWPSRDQALKKNNQRDQSFWRGETWYNHGPCPLHYSGRYLPGFPTHSDMWHQVRVGAIKAHGELTKKHKTLLFNGAGTRPGSGSYVCVTSEKYPHSNDVTETKTCAHIHRSYGSSEKRRKSLLLVLRFIKNTFASGQVQNMSCVNSCTFQTDS